MSDKGICVLYLQGDWGAVCQMMFVFPKCCSKTSEEEKVALSFKNRWCINPGLIVKPLGHN